MQRHQRGPVELRLTDRHDPRGEVDVGPCQADRFTDPHARGRLRVGSPARMHRHRAHPGAGAQPVADHDAVEDQWGDRTGLVRGPVTVCEPRPMGHADTGQVERRNQVQGQPAVPGMAMITEVTGVLRQGLTDPLARSSLKSP